LNTKGNGRTRHLSKPKLFSTAIFYNVTEFRTYIVVENIYRYNLPLFVSQQIDKWDEIISIISNTTIHDWIHPQVPDWSLQAVSGRIFQTTHSVGNVINPGRGICVDR